MIRPNFNLLGFPLEPGFRVIEAGAGSGKTYNLVRLVLRLLTRAENPVDVRKILLVTFTDAAALEMRQRLRGILEQALRPNLKGDLLEIMQVGKPAERFCRRRVSRALDNLGAMQVTTIHGFCLRAYGDHGVNCGFSPLAGDPVDSAALAAEIATDYLLRHPQVAHKPSAIIAAAKALFLCPDAGLPSDLEPLRTYVAQRAAAAPVVTFDSLITRLRDALHDGSKGAALTQLLRADFAACLIDESQDTDPAQWDIFNHLFGPASQSRDHFLLMVGDPKQSIYGFRGADVRTYVAASEQTPHIYTLPDNFRSSPRIIEAFNAIFSLKGFFGTEARIGFDLAKANGGIAELGSHPFEVIHSDRPDDVAREAARLLAELDAAGIRKEGKVEAHGDPAEVGILVRSNSEAARIYRALVAQGLGASLESQQSVFATTTAFQVQLLLRSVLSPSHAGHRRALLLSRPSLFGPSAKLDDATDNALARWLTECQTTWNKQKFSALWEQLTRTAPADGLLPLVTSLARSRFRNRSLMDLSHIGELLVARSSRNHWTPEQTFDHLSARVRDEDDAEASDANASEEESLRADSANARILVRTIHKSKGLEYNAVILAKSFQYKGESLRRGTLIRGDQAKADVFMNVDKEDPLRDTLLRQIREEDARLLYVALTRARQRFIWMGKAEPQSDKEPVYAGFSQVLADVSLPASFDAKRLTTPLIELTRARQPGQLDSAEAPSTPEPAQPYAPELLASPSHLPRAIGASSYTGLTQGKHGVASPVAGMDQPSSEPEQPADLLIPDSLRRGNILGNLLHKLMEVLDFPRVLAEPDYLRATIDYHLGNSGLLDRTDPAYAGTLDALCRSAAIWVNQPLQAHPGAPFRLADLASDQQLAEVRFSFAADIDQDSFPQLEAAFAEEFATAHPGSGLAGLGLTWERGAPLQGLLTGSVDFVCAHDGRFYVVDWKSNFVGSAAADYLPSALARSVAKERYHLQFSIYCLALDAHLRRCLGDEWDFSRDFGGVYYLYLRGFGLEPKTNHGAFYHRPSPAFLARLRSILQPEYAR